VKSSIYEFFHESEKIIMMRSFFSGPRFSPQWLMEYDSSSSSGEFGNNLLILGQFYRV